VQHWRLQSGLSLVDRDTAMGEAKRRTKAGTTTHAPNPGQAEDYRVPAGHIAFTLDFEGAGLDPTTVAFEASNLTAFMSLFDKVPGLGAAERTKPAIHVAVREKMVEVTKRARRGGDDGQELIMLAIWCSMYHPTSGQTMRDRVSRSLREKGTAHITISMDARKNFAFTLADKFADAQEILEAVPDDFEGGVEIVLGEGENPKLN
jgi:hypothetical protein